MDDILNKILVRLDELQKGQEELRIGQDELRIGQDELRSGIDGLKAGQESIIKRQDLLANEVAKLGTRMDHSDKETLDTKIDARILKSRVDKSERELYTFIEKSS